MLSISGEYHISQVYFFESVKSIVNSSVRNLLPPPIVRIIRLTVTPSKEVRLRARMNLRSHLVSLTILTLQKMTKMLLAEKVQAPSHPFSLVDNFRVQANNAQFYEQIQPTLYFINNYKWGSTIQQILYYSFADFGNGKSPNLLLLI